MPDEKRSRIARGARHKGRKAQTTIAKLLGIWMFNEVAKQLYKKELIIFKNGRYILNDKQI